MLLAILYAVWESFWRRCFGSNGWDKPIIKHRGVQHVLNALIFTIPLCMIKGYYFPLTIPVSICVAVYFTIIVQAFLWALHHGEWFGLGDDSKEDKRYFTKPLNKWVLTPIFDLFGWGKYGFAYDYAGMTLRYTLPCLCLVPIYGWAIILVGLAVTPIYAFSALFYERQNKNYGNTALAEWIVGALIGFWFTYLNWGGFLIKWLTIF